LGRLVLWQNNLEVQHYLLRAVGAPLKLAEDQSMKVSTTVLALLLLFAVCVSCRLAETLTGDKNAGTVSALWSDVPPFQGATKSDQDIPLGARLAIRAMMQGKISFISFQTDKTAQEVSDFYSYERMKSAGWTPNDKGCVSDSEDSKNHGAFCVFSKKDGQKEDGLAIIIAQDETKKTTSIFYARFDLSKPSK
jgi:hypothetical protein